MYFPFYVGGMSGYYLVFLIIPMVCGAIASAVASHRLKKYNKVSIDTNMSGSNCASQMLRHNEVGGVSFTRGSSDQDFFNPKDNSITLSPEYYSTVSVSANAVACHEAGHACQYGKGYWPMKARSALVPIVNAASNAWLFILILGVILNMTNLIYIAVIVFALVLLFQLITLPVEINASRRAVDYLSTYNLPEDQMKGAKRVLCSCAMTYLVAALMAALQLIWVLLRANDRN